LISLHRFNEASREDDIVSLLKDEKRIVLVSDAGLPCVADPGMALIARCHQEKIPVTAIPGPCAFATAYALSGAVCERMQFLGFLPKQSEDLSSLLTEMYQYPGASVAYESPHRVKETIDQAVTIDPSWEIVLVRELTKVYEEVVRLTSREMQGLLQERMIKGECTLVFLPCQNISRPTDDQLIKEVSSVRAEFSCTLKEAIDIVSKTHHLPQREVYRLCISKAT
jgi:16S rRNA (cytidine1402-2'-O)-methyltransferase